MRSISTRLYLSGGPCLLSEEYWGGYLEVLEGRPLLLGEVTVLPCACSLRMVVTTYPTELLLPTAASARAREAHCELEILTDSLRP